MIEVMAVMAAADRLLADKSTQAAFGAAVLALAGAVVAATITLVGKRGETRVTADVQLRGDLLSYSTELRGRVDALEETERRQAETIRQQARLIDQQQREMESLSARVRDLERELGRAS